jgi:hypothetical protein
VGRREPWTTKQKVLIVLTGTIIEAPLFISLFGYFDGKSPRLVGAVGGATLLVGVPLLALVSEKWIRKVK